MISELQFSYLVQVFQTRITAGMVQIVTKMTGNLMHYSAHTTMERLPPALALFLRQLCIDTQISPAVLFVAGVYLKRLQQRLPPESTGNNH